MERHPVPQNIMDVEFKLFGSLTVKQFGNLAIGAFAAVITYFLGFPGILKWPLIVFFVLLGLSLALLRVNDQPFGRWLGNFIIAMFTNQRKVWKKTPKVPDLFTKTYKADNYDEQILSKTKKQLPAFLQQETKQSIDIADKGEEEALKRLDYYIQNDIKAAKPGKNDVQKQESVSPVINPSQGKLAGETNSIQEKLENFPQSKNYSVVTSEEKASVNRPVSSKLVHKNLAEMLGSIEVATDETNPKIASVNSDPGGKSTNMISGVVMSKKGEVVASARIIIKDEKQALVRSLMTDDKGSFSSTTSLPNGSYIIEIQSDTYAFDKFKVNLDGKNNNVYKFVSK